MKNIYFTFLSIALLTGCIVDDDAYSQFESTSNVYCCIEGPSGEVSEIARLKMSYEANDTAKFINQVGDTSIFYVSEQTQFISMDTIYQGYNDGYAHLNTLVDTLGITIDRQSIKTMLTSDDLDLTFSIIASTRVGRGGIRQDVELYDVLLITSDRIFGYDFASILFARNADQFAFTFEFTEQLPPVEFNNRTYEGVIRMRNFENSIHYKFTQGIIAFFDPSTGYIWSLIE